jgi:hypothetical protein
MSDKKEPELDRGKTGVEVRCKQSMDRSGKAPKVSDFKEDLLAADAGKDTREQSQVAQMQGHHLLPSRSGPAFRVQELGNDLSQKEEGKPAADYSRPKLLLSLPTPPRERKRKNHGYRDRG